MTLARLAAFPVVLALALAGAGCGLKDGVSGDPKDTVVELAAAINEFGDVDRLLCDAVRGESMGLDEMVRAAADADPKLGNIRYKATPGSIINKTDTSATGILVVEFQGVPADLSPAGMQFLDRRQPPRPINLIGDNDQIPLVVEDGKWVACKS